MKLFYGEDARDFTATDIFGNKVTLSNYKGQKIYLSFMRNVSCPFCNVRVHNLMGHNYELKETGIEIILLFESNNTLISESVLHRGLLPWTMIGDSSKKIYDLYNVESSYTKMMRTMLSSNVMGIMKIKKTLPATPKDKNATSSLIPADFFIDENFKIHTSYYGKDINDHISIEKIKEWAKSN